MAAKTVVEAVVTEEPVSAKEFMAGLQGTAEMGMAFCRIEGDATLRLRDTWLARWEKFKTKPTGTPWDQWVGEV